MDGFKYLYEQGVYTKKQLQSYMPYVISAQDYEYITGEQAPINSTSNNV